jgi:DNA-binding LacI/PurR family transcriptional regulator
MPGRPTIRDVARRAGVSHMTVSRVLNGHQAVSAATRERVEQAIQDLAFTPSPIARGLVADRTHSIGLVSTDISDYFFSQAAAGAEIEARRRGHFLIIASVEEAMESDERGYLRLMLERRVEGLIIARPKPPVSVEKLRASAHGRLPVVAIGSVEGPGYTVVDVDNQGGGRQAVRLLLERGHRSIATITGPLVWPSAVRRLAGYRDALQEAGAGVDDSLVVNADGWGLANGQTALGTLLDRDQEFTALFAQSDMIAIGAIRELRARGLQVPRDVSVVGYDDHPVASFVDPPLTTVRQPTREVGERAAAHVLDALAEGAPAAGTASGTDLLPTRVVVRDSVVAPRPRRGTRQSREPSPDPRQNRTKR